MSCFNRLFPCSRVAPSALLLFGSIASRPKDVQQILDSLLDLPVTQEELDKILLVSIMKASSCLRLSFFLWWRSCRVFFPREPALGCMLAGTSHVRATVPLPMFVKTSETNGNQLQFEAFCSALPHAFAFFSCGCIVDLHAARLAREEYVV